MPKVKINETDIGDGDDSEDGVEFDEAAGRCCPIEVIVIYIYICIYMCIYIYAFRLV